MYIQSKLAICFFILFFSCEEAEYKLDNPFDPENLDLTPPALFFHPPYINTIIDTTIAIEIYGLDLGPSAAARMDIRYDWGSIVLESVVPGPFYSGNNSPMEITVDEQGILDIFLFYVPDIDTDQNQGGTQSIATMYFSTVSVGESELLFGENTILINSNNDSLNINEFGKGYVNVE